MIKQIIKALKENSQVTAWQVKEILTETTEQFYVIQNLETTRKTNVDEFEVTVFHEEGDFVGSANFLVSHKLKKNELDELINEALYAAKFVKNPKYSLVEGPLKKNFKSKVEEVNPYDVLTKCADIFFSVSKENAKFNSLELFYEVKSIHLVNSNGVDLKKNLFDIAIESVPSYNGEDKVEIYRMFHYSSIDYDKVKNDAMEAINDVTYRNYAKKPEGIKNADVILRCHDSLEFFESLIGNLSTASLYHKQATHQIGEMVQPVINGDAITIKLGVNQKADAFDDEGVIIKPITVIEEGKFVNSYGSNRFSKYMGVEATGNPGRVIVNKGKTSQEKMHRKPYLEIITLSGIQIDIFAGYIGGEVRLALYYDGENTYPVSGFSFSGSLNNALENIKLSKEIVNERHYTGPKYVMLKGMEVL